MDKFYLFGAGINCEGVIKYFGTENIIGIIDSNRELHGKKYIWIEYYRYK